MGGGNGGEVGRVFRNNYKGHIYKTKVGWNHLREVGMDQVWGEGR